MDTLDQLCNLGLDPGEAAPFSKFSLKPTLIKHRHFNAVIRRIANLHRRGLDGRRAEGFLLAAQSGTGKTRLLKHYIQFFPRYEEHGYSRIPALYVETPQGATPGSLASAFLIALGDPFPHKGTKDQRTDRVDVLIKSCEVELIFVDEFQNCYEGKTRNEREDVPNWLKLRLNKAEIPMVVSGLPRSIHALKANRELRRRFLSPHYYPPFTVSDESEFALFRSVLKELQAQLPLPSIALHDRNIAMRMYFATNGLLDYVIKILESAVTESCGDMYQLSLPDYEAAFELAVANALPGNLNPFAENAELRPLMKASEPFEKWEDPVALGLIPSKPKTRPKSHALKLAAPTYVSLANSVQHVVRP